MAKLLVGERQYHLIFGTQRQRAAALEQRPHVCVIAWIARHHRQASEHPRLTAQITKRLRHLQTAHKERARHGCIRDRCMLRCEEANRLERAPAEIGW